MQNRLAHVDSMRGIAVLLVVWLHTTEIFAGLDAQISGTWLLEVAAVVDFGRIGVVLFFFISGFVIPASLVGERRATSARFLKRRFFRLYPAYWVSIILALIFTWWASGRTIDPWVIAANLTMVQEVFGAPDILGLYWTLRVELFFYGLCLLLFLAGWLHQDFVLAAIASAFLAVFLVLYALPILAPSYQTDLRYWNAHFAFVSIMFTGALWRRYWDRNVSWVGKLYLAAASLFWLVAFPALALVYWARTGELSLDQTKFYFSYPIATLLFIVLLLYVRITWRPLVLVGEISYSMYLLHPVVASVLLLVSSLQPMHWLVSQHLSVPLVIVISLSIVVAWLNYRFVELPMIGLGRRDSHSTRTSPA